MRETDPSSRPPGTGGQCVRSIKGPLTDTPPSALQEFELKQQTRQACLELSPCQKARGPALGFPASSQLPKCSALLMKESPLSL